MRSLRIALAQIDPTVGDLEGNVSKIITCIKAAKSSHADLVAFPELAITGYPPEDLLLKGQFIEDNLQALNKVRKSVVGITAIVGFVDRRDDIFNAAAIIHDRKLIDVYHKMHLPNYGVFDEFRYFQAGTRYPVYQLAGTRIGVNICEDIWYPEGPPHVQALGGAELIININASPYHIGKGRSRETMLSTRASDNIVVVAYVNTVGGQDELVFDGHSMVLDQDGEVVARGRQFKEDLVIADLNLESITMRRLHAPRRRQEILKLGTDIVEEIIVPPGERSPAKRAKSSATSGSKSCRVMEPLEEIYAALVLGTSDYVKKNGFKGVVVAVSGGIDSALVATIAVDALGKENVKGLFMPSRFTSVASREDAYALAANLEIDITEVPIDGVFDSYLVLLKETLASLRPDVTEENLQARIRGNIVMSFSNKFGWLVLTTGNKSEMSVGYATLYGDMAGGFAVIKDVPKTMVYDLCRWKDGGNGSVIPERMFTKEPSAELKPNQKDTDTLPPYSLLDPILKAYIEEDMSFEGILSLGYDAGGIRKVIGMIDRNEYKRRQAPPGIKISRRAFGKDRRFPITNKYRGF